MNRIESVHLYHWMLQTLIHFEWRSILGKCHPIGFKQNQVVWNWLNCQNSKDMPNMSQKWRWMMLKIDQQQWITRRITKRTYTRAHTLYVCIWTHCKNRSCTLLSCPPRTWTGWKNKTHRELSIFCLSHLQLCLARQTSWSGNRPPMWWMKLPSSLMFALFVVVCSRSIEM